MILLTQGADLELADAHGRDCYGWVSSTWTGWMGIQSHDCLMHHLAAHQPAQVAAIQGNSIALALTTVR